MLNKKFSMLPSKLPPHVTAFDAFYGRGTANRIGTMQRRRQKNLLILGEVWYNRGTTDRRKADNEA